MGRINYYTSPAEKLFFQKTNFMGGINNTTADDLVPENCEKNIVNLDLNYAGALTKRAGFIRHTNLHNIIKPNQTADFSDYPSLLTDEIQAELEQRNKVQGIFQWKDNTTNKEYIVMLYCNQVYIRLSALSETKGTLNEYETWVPVAMQKYDEANSTHSPYLSGTSYEYVEFRENAEQATVRLEVPIFSKVYDDNNSRRVITGADELATFVQNDMAKCYKVDGVAYGGDFYLATGYKLMILKNEGGTITAKQLAPVIPTTPEYNTIGGNLLSVDPANAIKSSTGVSFQASGMVITSTYDGKTLRSGLVNNPVNIRVITIRPSESMSVYYRLRYQKQGDTEWTNKSSENNGWQAFTIANGADITWEVLLNQATLYNFSVEIIPADQMNTSTWEPENVGYVVSYVYTSYEVKETPDFMPVAEFSIHTCRRLLVYYDQLLAYKDTMDGNVIYISDYRRFNYFPADFNTIIDTATKDEITSINYYQNVLIVLTENNIFMLKGRNPYDFSLSNINRTIGCRYGWTARAVGNYLYFMSIEGLFRLKSIYNTEDRLNVEQVDFRIKSLFLDKPADYIAYTFKGNYYLVEMAPYVFDKEAGSRSSLNGRIYIYDTNLEAWTTYEGAYLNINNSLILGNYMCVTDRNTNSFMVFPELEVLGQEITAYTDGETYAINADNSALEKVFDGVNYLTRVEEIYNSLGKPYNTKKFKEFMLKVLNSKQGDTGLMVTVMVDGQEVVDPLHIEVIVEDITGTVIPERELQTNIAVPTIATLGESFKLGKTVLGNYEISLHRIKFSGKGKTIKYIIEQSDDKFFGVLGYATVYKEKKPSVK